MTTARGGTKQPAVKVNLPNVTTVAAMQEARQGELASFETVSDLMADLNTQH